MNKLIRPCTLPSVWVGVLDGKDSPFVIDAVRFEGLHYTPSTSYNLEEYFIVRVDLCNPRTTAMAYHPKENVEHLMRCTLGIIHEALNAPVLATEEVLAGLPKDGAVYTVDEKTGDALKCTLDDEYGWRCRAGFLNEALELGKPYRIFTIKDFKTLDYLLQFYTDGTPVSKGGSND